MSDSTAISALKDSTMIVRASITYKGASSDRVEIRFFTKRQLRFSDNVMSKKRWNLKSMLVLAEARSSLSSSGSRSPKILRV